MAQGAWDELDATREALAARYDRYRDLGLGVHADKLREGGPVPGRITGTPVIMDTDIGGDPDDAVALLVAALRLPDLALVLTCDEYGGERARFARHLLDLVGRPDVPVVAGRQLAGGTRYFCVEGLTPPSVTRQYDDPVKAAEWIVDHAPEQVRWLGIGPMSNLAELLFARPDLAGRLRLIQMGGALSYRDPSRAEHNIRLDVPAALSVLRTVERPWLVTSDVTFTPEMELTATSSLYRVLKLGDAPPWATLLGEHFDRWFARFHPGSMQHDALALSVVMQQPLVDFDLARINFDESGRMSPAAKGDDSAVRAFVSSSAHYQAFHGWLERQLTGRTLSTTVGEAGR
jgi:inosine-uridine nucleoside N-ribohydrolase